MNMYFALPFLMLFGALLGSADAWPTSPSPSDPPTTAVIVASTTATSSASTTQSSARPLAHIRKHPQTKLSTRATTSPSTSETMTLAAKPLAPSTTPPVSEPTQSSPAPSLMSDVEREVLRLTNIERHARGLADLSADGALTTIARAHSTDMGERAYFDHTNPEGCGSSCRATHAGYAWRAIGENIYMMSGYRLSPNDVAAKIVTGWMDSPDHRDNMLGEKYTNAGIGVWSDGRDTYATALYTLPR